MRRVRPRGAAAILSLMVTFGTLSAARDADAQCSSGGSCPPCTMCRVGPASGTNPTVTAMSTLFDQIAAGPTVYGSLGWDFAGRTTIGEGPGWCTSGGRDVTSPVHFPCLLLKAIYATESNWRQFCSTNQTVISFDCGYGIAQVTSGMRSGDTSAFDPNRVASDSAYNVSVGAAILADKWRASPCVGANALDVIEDWYFAVWGYNGFAASNNPNNPTYAAARPEFRTPGVASAQVRSNYPYQEIVWGYAHYPPSAQHYASVALAYPVRSEICASCGYPGNISEPAGSHRSVCTGVVPPTDAGVDVVQPRDVVSPPDVTDVVARVDVSNSDVVADALDDARADTRADTRTDARADARGGGAEGGCACSTPVGRTAPGRRLAWLAFGLAAINIRRRARPAVRKSVTTR